MHQNLSLHTWTHQNRHPSSKCTGNLPLTHEWSKIVSPQVYAPESHPSYMNALTSSFLKSMHRNLTPHTWMHRNRHSSGTCTEILPLTYECTEIINPHINAPQSYPPLIYAPYRHFSEKCTKILPLIHECTEIVFPQVNAPESYPSHINAPKSSLR